MPGQVDRADLGAKVQAMYRDVARNPHRKFHFEMGRVIVERLGYLTGGPRPHSRRDDRLLPRK